MIYTAGKLSALGNQNSSSFLCRVKWRNATDHNKFDALHLVYALTSEQMMMNWKFFLLGTWCHSLMWFETQSTVKKNIFTNFAKKLSTYKLHELLQWWLMASSKPCSHICDIFNVTLMHSVNFLNGPAFTILLSILSYFEQKNHEINRQNCQSIVVEGFYWNHGKLASGFTKWLCTSEQTENCG